MMGFALMQAARGLRRDLGANALVIAVLSVGIASVLIIFSFVKALMIDPPPFANAAHVVKLGFDAPDVNGDTYQANPSGADLLVWERELSSLGALAGVTSATMNLSDGIRPERFEGAFISADLFALLGVAPVLGRGFSASDFAPDAAQTILISDALWRTRFNADRAIIGQTTRLNGTQAQIIGVMPERFTFPQFEQLWSARGLAGKNADLENDYETFFLPRSEEAKTEAIARLQAWHKNAKRIATSDEEILTRKDQLSIRTSSLELAKSNAKKLLSIMLAGVVLLLFVACGNAASVMLVRVLAQSAEQAVQLALGSGFWRLAMNLILQTLILALISAAIASVLAIVGGAYLLAELGPDGLPGYVQFGGTWQTFGLSVLCCLFAAALTLLMPLRRLWRSTTYGSLHSSARSTLGSSAGQWLIALQVAVSCAVLVNTFVIVRVVQALENTSLGIDESQLLTGRIALFEANYPSDAAVLSFTQTLQQKLQALPGVASASINSVLPGDLGDSEQVLFPGDDPLQATDVFAGAVDAQFAQAYGVKLLAGRFFDARDQLDSASVVVIDQNAAARFGGPAKAIGQSIVRVSENNQRSTVIGVVNALRLDEIDDAREMTVLAPMSQKNERFFTIVLRASRSTNPASLKAAMQQTVASADADMPVYWLRTYPEIRRETMASERVLSTIFSGMGVIALLLSGTGLYGLMSFLANQRKREFGLRRALGAQAGAVIHALLGLTSLQVFGGIIVGLAIGVPAASLLSGIFRGEISLDFAAAGAVLCLVAAALIASIMPTRRALSVQPQIALRGE